MNKTVRDLIRALDVDQRISSLELSNNKTPQIRKFNVTQKSLKLVKTDIIKYISHLKTVHTKASHRRYTCLCHV